MNKCVIGRERRLEEKEGGEKAGEEGGEELGGRREEGGEGKGEMR